MTYSTTDTTYEKQPIKNMLHVKPGQVRNPSTLIMIAECNCWWNYQIKSGDYQNCWIKGYGFQTINSGNVSQGPPYTHYGKRPGDGKMNYCFCDGHVELLIPVDTNANPNCWIRQ